MKNEWLDADVYFVVKCHASNGFIPDDGATAVRAGDGQYAFVAAKMAKEASAEEGCAYAHVAKWSLTDGITVQASFHQGEYDASSHSNSWEGHRAWSTLLMPLVSQHLDTQCRIRAEEQAAELESANPSAAVAPMPLRCSKCGADLSATPLGAPCLDCLNDQIQDNQYQEMAETNLREGRRYCAKHNEDYTDDPSGPYCASCWNEVEVKPKGTVAKSSDPWPPR